MAKFIQGHFRPKNPDKYDGKIALCVYRSSWELKYMMELDNDLNVIKWSSESVIIGYKDGMGVLRRYYVDFKVERKTVVEGVSKTELIEIKPEKETLPPILTNSKGSKKNRKTLIKEALTYDKNQAKWQAARAYCAKKGWEFLVKSEYELGIKKKK